MRKYNISCCVNTSRNSKNFLNIRNWPNSAPTHGFFAKNIDKRQFFITHDEEGPDDMKTSCREYTLPRSEETSRVRGWIRGNTEVGPVLHVNVCYHQGRCGVVIMIETEQFLGFASWTESTQYVTETSEEIPVASVEWRGTGKLVAKAEPHYQSRL